MLVVDLFLPARAKAAVDVGRRWSGRSRRWVRSFSLIGGGTRVVFGGAYVVDATSLIFQVFFLAAAIAVLLISYRYLREGGFYQGEYYFLLMTSFLGCVLMPASRNLLMLFLALELVSAPGFLMAAFRKSDIKGNEGGLKFFIIGVLSTAVMLYGMSLIYGLTGQLELHAIANGLSTLPGAHLTLAKVAILFVVVGFAFKVSAVPFQFWAPDTYEGAPVPVAAFLGVASSAAGFAGLLQLMFVAFVGAGDVLVADLRGARGPHDDAGEPRRAPTAAGGAPAGVLGDRAVRLHPAAVRPRDGRRRPEHLGVPRDGHLHLDLRRDEHRRVRRGDRGQPSAGPACRSRTSPAWRGSRRC